MDKLLVINYTLSQYFQKDIRTKEYKSKWNKIKMLLIFSTKQKVGICPP